MSYAFWQGVMNVVTGWVLMKTFWCCQRDWMGNVYCLSVFGAYFECFS